MGPTHEIVQVHAVECLSLRIVAGLLDPCEDGQYGGIQVSTYNTVYFILNRCLSMGIPCGTR